MKKLALLSLIAFTLSACGGNKYEFNKEEFDKGETAYVVLGGTHNAKHKDFPVSSYFYFKSEDGNSINLKVPEGEKAKGFMIPFGNYNLVEYSLYGSQTYGNMKISIDLNFEDKIAGGFDVKAGDAIYLGTVDTQITKVDKNTFRKIFNMGTYESDLSYTSVVNNEFKNIDKDTFEKQVGKTITPFIMKWQKIETMDTKN